MRRRDDRPLQREDDLGGVVDVWIVDVGELKRPAARFQVGPTHRPVAAFEDLLVEQPIGAADHRRVIAGDTGVMERDQREARVPHGRLAGFHPARVVLIDREALHPLQAATHQRMIERIAEQMQRNQRVHPRRLHVKEITRLSQNWDTSAKTVTAMSI